MNSNVVISVDARKPRKDGTSPIIFRLSHQGLTASFSSGYRVEAKYFDQSTKQIKSNCPQFESVKTINNTLAKRKAEIIDAMTRLADEDKLDFMTISEVKDHVLGKRERVSLFSFVAQLVDELKAQNRLGTARSYRSLLLALKLYHKGKDLKLDQVTTTFLIKYETWYMTPTDERPGQKSLNGLAVNMRTLKAVLNKAIQRGILDGERYPFKNYKIKTQPTRKRAISNDAISKIIHLKLGQEHPLFLARNVFLMSYFLYGMPFVDLAKLKMSNISEGRIRYDRSKTKRPYDIKISQPLQEILKYYTFGKQKDDFILPIVHRFDTEGMYKNIEWARRRYNKKLRQLAELAGIEETLTSYVSRHTFASQMNNMGVPISAISEMMGHGEIRTTQTYLASLSTDSLDQYNAQLISKSA